MSITVHNCPFCDHDDVEIGEVSISAAWNRALRPLKDSKA